MKLPIYLVTLLSLFHFHLIKCDPDDPDEAIEEEKNYIPCASTVNVEQDHKYYFKNLKYGGDNLEYNYFGGYRSTDEYRRPTCTWTFLTSDECHLMVHFQDYSPGDRPCSVQYVSVGDHQTIVKACGYNSLPVTFESTSNFVVVKHYRKPITQSLTQFEGYVICHSIGTSYADSYAVLPPVAINTTVPVYYSEPVVNSYPAPQNQTNYPYASSQNYTTSYPVVPPVPSPMYNPPVYNSSEPTTVYNSPVPTPVYNPPVPSSVYNPPVPSSVYNPPVAYPVYNPPEPTPVYNPPVSSSVYNSPVYTPPLPTPVYNPPVSSPVYNLPVPTPVYAPPVITPTPIPSPVYPVVSPVYSAPINSTQYNPSVYASPPNAASYVPNGIVQSNEYSPPVTTSGSLPYQAPPVYASPPIVNQEVPYNVPYQPIQIPYQQQNPVAYTPPIPYLPIPPQNQTQPL